MASRSDSPRKADMDSKEAKAELFITHITPHLQAAAKHMLTVASEYTTSRGIENMLSLVYSLIKEDLSEQHEAKGVGPMVALYIHIVGFMTSAEAIYKHFGQLNAMSDVRSWQHALVASMATMVQESAEASQDEVDQEEPDPSPDTLN